MKVNVIDLKDIHVLTLRTYKHVTLFYLLTYSPTYSLTHSLTYILFFARDLEDLIAKNFEMEMILDYLLGTM